MFFGDYLPPDQTIVRLKTELLTNIPSSTARLSLFAEDLDASESAFDIYDQQFGEYKTKHIQLGPKFQIDLKNIPLITDILEVPEKYQEDLAKCQKLENEHLVWDPTRLNSD